MTDIARQVVEYVVDYVEKAGRFEGRGKSRMLTFPLVINMKTGETRECMDDMADNVRSILDGKATYTHPNTCYKVPA